MGLSHNSSKKHITLPDFLIESSWEVCNKVGGIHTVLSSRAKIMSDLFGDSILFVGPDLNYSDVCCSEFVEDNTIYSQWKEQAAKDGLKIKIGRWKIIGNPIAILVNYQSYFSDKNDIYKQLWDEFQVDSLHAYGDYDDAAMFAYATGKVVESFCKYVAKDSDNIVFHGNEWMSGVGLLYVKLFAKNVSTVFTTHATTVGRSISYNGKPLYDYFSGYNGDQMAFELNVQSKHSLEKQTAHYVDCFTTVSKITAKECKQLLDKDIDAILPNGFNNEIVPKGTEYTRKRTAARNKIVDIVNDITKLNYNNDCFIISTSGRFEFRNKGIDIFLWAMSKMKENSDIYKNIIALVYVPSIKDKISCETYGSLSIIYVPYYLDGHDGTFNLSYYDLLIGSDLTIYPSYYEPWGYTPLESIAFHIPTITTDVAGFGAWVKEYTDKETAINNGVAVVERNDHNNEDAVENIVNIIKYYYDLSPKEKSQARQKAFNLSKKASWEKFYKCYLEAYNIAINKRK